MLIEIIKPFFLRQKLQKLKAKINKLIKMNDNLIKQNSKLLIELSILKQPFETKGDLTDSAFRLLMEEEYKKSK